MYDILTRKMASFQAVFIARFNDSDFASYQEHSLTKRENMTEFPTFIVLDPIPTTSHQTKFCLQESCFTLIPK